MENKMKEHRRGVLEKGQVWELVDGPRLPV